MSQIYTQRYKKLLARLIEAREKVGLTQEQVAKKLKKPQSFMSKIESGERRVDVVELENLSQVYGLSLNFFQTLKEENGSE